MSKTLSRAVVTLALLFATVSGFLAIPATPAFGSQEPLSWYCKTLPEHALRSGFVPASCENVK